MHMAKRTRETARKGTRPALHRGLSQSLEAADVPTPSSQISTCRSCHRVFGNRGKEETAHVEIAPMQAAQLDALTSNRTA